MSAIRLSVPGQPTRLIDLGPSVARFHGSAAWGTRNAAVLGGMIPFKFGRAKGELGHIPTPAAVARAARRAAK